MSLQKSIGKHIELLRDIAAMEILRDHPENHSQFFKFLTYQINGDAFAEPLVAVLDVDNKHDIEAELREFLTDTHADEYCVSYVATATTSCGCMGMIMATSTASLDITPMARRLSSCKPSRPSS